MIPMREKRKVALPVRHKKVLRFSVEGSRVLQFLRKSVPPFPSDEAVAWQAEARSLGTRAVPYLKNALANANPPQQYAALLALRQLGYEAHGEEYGRHLKYVVNGHTIVPRKR